MCELTRRTAAAGTPSYRAELAVHEAIPAYHARVAARDSAKAQLDMIRPLVEHGIEPRMTLVQMQSAAAVATTDAASAAAGVSRGKAAVTEARPALTQVHEDWRSQAAADLASAPAELSARASGDRKSKRLNSRH